MADTTKDAAREIERYLAANPGAADTAEGIASWWHSGCRGEQPANAIEKALALLVSNGTVSVNRLASGETIYSLARNKKPRWRG